MQNCSQCKSDFVIDKFALDFYEKIQVPQPTFCPDCRSQRRMIFRNERHLYNRPCDLCAKNFLSIFHQNVAFPVYCYSCWWSDKWDARDYGIEYNSNVSFFQQIQELFNKVPHLGIVSSHCENSDYVNHTNYSKNCYLIFGCHGDENCYYCWRVHDSLECLDCAQVDKSQYCYECVDCDECYQLTFSQDCSHCSNSGFLYDCKGCKDCYFSAGLRNKQYCIFNKQYSKEDYEKVLQSLNLGSQQGLKLAKQKFAEFIKSYPRRATYLQNSENVSGDHIINSQNTFSSFNVKNIQDGAYLESCEDLKDAMDCTFSGWPAELVYEGISAGCVNSYNTKFCIGSWSCSNIEYCDSCHHSKELFGCISLRQKNEYCILNKQYSVEEYTALKAKIIADMKQNKEYGEFFAASISPFAYNESIANEYFPLSKEEALTKGYMWRQEDKKDYLPATYKLPDHIQQIPETIATEILACEKCSKNYKIIGSELQFYRKFQLPVPSLCFGCRHQERMDKRNPRHLWQRNCSKCQTQIETTYSPERPEKIYCEKCYQEAMY